MNYSKIYDSLIERGVKRISEGNVEVHHIVPRCMGGSDDKTNLVALTPEEHYLAHQLLVKIYPNNHALVKAAAMMIPNRPSNKLYGWLRRRFGEVKSIEQSGEGNSQFGTMWINSKIERVSKKIRNTDTIPDGWDKGYIVDWDSYDSRELESQKKKDQLIEKKEMYKEMYSELYKIYCKVGWSEFVKQTGYSYSQPNFVTRCSIFVEDYVSQNGKKR